MTALPPPQRPSPLAIGFGILLGVAWFILVTSIFPVPAW